MDKLDNCVHSVVFCLLVSVMLKSLGEYKIFQDSTLNKSILLKTDKQLPRKSAAHLVQIFHRSLLKNGFK